MNYQNWVLNRLLEKYEVSKSFYDLNQKNKIAFRVGKETDLMERLVDPDQKRKFLQTLASLKEQKLVDYEWYRFEEGNLIDRVWLTAHLSNQLEEAYAKSKRLNLRKELDLCLRRMQDQQSYLNKNWILNLLQKLMDELIIKHKFPQCLSGNWGDVLTAIEGLDTIEGEQLERVFSVKHFGDSKWFERHVKSKLLSTLRLIQTDLTDTELLQWVGLVRYPEVMEFCGELEVLTKDGKRIDFSQQCYGAYINSNLIHEVSEVFIPNINRVIFIENKTNYIAYLSNHYNSNELVIYHGGVFSPMKQKWFEHLYRAAYDASFYHWSDIDVGGFTIFCRLRDIIIPPLQPYQMDEAVLRLYQDKGIRIESESYLKRLEELEMDERYEIFHPLIRQMLTLRIRLEQEVMI